MTRNLVVFIAGALLAGVLSWAGPTAAAQDSGGLMIERVSVGDRGQQALSLGGGAPISNGVSANGDIVAFDSSSGGLVDGDTNESIDGFLRSRSAATTQRVTVDSNGAQLSYGKMAAVSQTGQFVAFSSAHVGIVGAGADANGLDDLFLRDRDTGVVERINVSSTGEQANGRITSNYVGISADGDTVVFESSGTNLVEGDTTSGTNVFVRDRVGGITKRIELNAARNGAGGRSPAITPDGRYVALIGPGGYIYRYDNATETSEIASTLLPGWSDPHIGDAPDISADGRFIVYTFTGNIAVGTQVIMRDMESTGPVQVVSANAAGEWVGGVFASISDDGRYVAFGSSALDLGPTIDPADAGQVYVFDQHTQVMRLVSVNADGDPANSTPRFVEISGDGSTVVFSSRADNLVPGDTNGASDVFAVDVDLSDAGCFGNVITIFGAGEIVGTDGDDVIQGSSGADIIDGGDGNDIICGLRGNDQITGGGGDDQIFAGDGADIIAGGDGTDRVFGGAGNDTIRGGDSKDMLYGGPGDDFVQGGAGDDMLGGGPGDDRVIGGPGADAVGGGDGDDLCRGSAGLDRYFLCETKQP